MVHPDYVFMALCIYGINLYCPKQSILGYFDVL